MERLKQPFLPSPSLDWSQQIHRFDLTQPFYFMRSRYGAGYTIRPLLFLLHQPGNCWWVRVGSNHASSSSASASIIIKRSLFSSLFQEPFLSSCCCSFPSCVCAELIKHGVVFGAFFYSSPLRLLLLAFLAHYERDFIFGMAGECVCLAVTF